MSRALECALRILNMKIQHIFFRCVFEPRLACDAYYGSFFLA